MLQIANIVELEKIVIVQDKSFDAYAMFWKEPASLNIMR